MPTHAKRIWYPLLFTFAIVGCASALWSCSAGPSNPTVDLAQGAKCYVYDAGHIIHIERLAADSDVVRQLDEVLRNQCGKWKTSLITYAPGILFEGNGFSITLQQDKVVVNYADAKGNRRQAVTDLPAAVFTALRQQVLMAR